MESNKRFLVKSVNIISWSEGCEGHFLKRTVSVAIVGWHLELDDRYVRSVLDKSDTSQGKAMVTSGSTAAATATATTATSGKERILSSSEDHDRRCLAGLCQYMTEMEYDITFATREFMRGASESDLAKGQEHQRDFK